MDRTMKTTMVVLSLCLLGMTTVGCGAGAASIVRRGAYSGELALSGTVIDSHYAAEAAMLEHCDGRARIVDATEGGELSVSDASDGAAKADDASISGERVHYVCVTRAETRD